MAELRNTDELSTLDDFLAGEGKLEAFQAIAIKEVLARQIEEAMKAEKLSRKRMAEKMGPAAVRSAGCWIPETGMSRLPHCNAPLRSWGGRCA